MKIQLAQKIKLGSLTVAPPSPSQSFDINNYLKTPDSKIIIQNQII